LRLMMHNEQKGAEERIWGEKSATGPLAVEAAAGAAAGALIGAITGPPGGAIGAMVGGAGGGGGGGGLAWGGLGEVGPHAQLARDLDVIGGRSGERKLAHPPPVHGLFHANTLGISAGTNESSDGPIQNVDGAE